MDVKIHWIELWKVFEVIIAIYAVIHLMSECYEKGYNQRCNEMQTDFDFENEKEE